MLGKNTVDFPTDQSACGFDITARVQLRAPSSM